MKSFFSKFFIVIHLSFVAIPSIAQPLPRTVLGLNNAQHFQSKHSGEFYIQLGVFKNKENAYRFEKTLRLKTKHRTQVWQKNGRYIINLGPIKSAAEVRATAHVLASFPPVSQHVKKPPQQASGYSSVKKQQCTMKHQTWSVTASLGYTNYQAMYLNTGQTMLGRLAIGKEFFTKEAFGFGMELGVQNGNSMQLGASDEALNVLGGLPIQSTVKPVFDVLATLSTAPIGRSILFGQLKGGVAYRSWQFEDRHSINNLSRLAGEVQAGLGFQLSERTKLSLLYQGIFGGNPKFSVNPITETGHVNSIPIQQGLLLSLSLIV